MTFRYVRLSSFSPPSLSITLARMRRGGVHGSFKSLSIPRGIATPTIFHPWRGRVISKRDEEETIRMYLRVSCLELFLLPCLSFVHFERKPSKARKTTATPLASSRWCVAPVGQTQQHRRRAVINNRLCGLDAPNSFTDHQRGRGNKRIEPSLENFLPT